jgi:hypothetical protein
VLIENGQIVVNVPEREPVMVYAREGAIAIAPETRSA